MAKKRRLKVAVVGKSDNNKSILSGDTIFKLMDTHGLPLDVITEILRRKDLGFDLFGFIKAAKASKNYSKKRIRTILVDNAPLEVDTEFYTRLDFLLSIIYDETS